MPASVATLCLLVAAAAGGIAAGPPEEELKAAMVLGFARFTEWPEGFHSDGPIRIGVAGRADFAQILERITAGRSATGGRRLEVKLVKTLADAAACHVLYFAGASARETKALLEGVRGAPVVTIGESDRFLESGGAIHLFEDDGRIAFEISADSIARCGVSVSAKLLKLGRIVHARGSRQ